MVGPVICEDGHSYERAAIQMWFNEGSHSSPVTNLAFETTVVFSNQT